MTRTSSWSSVASGLVGGGAVGLLTVAMPVVGLVLLAVGVVIALARAVRRPDERRHEIRTLGGLLIGSGALFTFGALMVIVRCASTTDFCGRANPFPLLGGGVVLLALGLLGTWRSRGTA
jgi:hypothetical protein